METQGFFIILGTIFCFSMVAWFITLIIDFIRPKSNQFTMQNPPEPPVRPKTEYEVYCELNLERIELIKKINEVDFKLKEILSKQPTWYKNQMYETALKSMSNNLKDVMTE